MRHGDGRGACSREIRQDRFRGEYAVQRRHDLPGIPKPRAHPAADRFLPRTHRRGRGRVRFGGIGFCVDSRRRPTNSAMSSPRRRRPSCSIWTSSRLSWRSIRMYCTRSSFRRRSSSCWDPSCRTWRVSSENAIS